jgi:SWIM zinc finger
MVEWSRERTEQLAPDAASAKAGLGLAKPAHWRTLGQADHMIWGECQGSGANPYQVRVALADAGYRCTCPSRKQPCKHTLGLLYLYAGGASFPKSAPPAFVEEWVASRAKRADAKAARESQPSAPVDPEAQARRQDKRESRILLGLEQLQAWMSDIMAQGLANTRTQPPSFWTQMASRLVDAQAPGLANRVRDMAAAVLSEERWSERLLGALARMQLLLDAYRRIESLPPPLAAEVRTLVGWTQKQEELLAQSGTQDHWQVIGRRQVSEDTLRVQSTWLQGAASHRLALVLDFAVGRQAFASAFMLGQVYVAEAVFFEGVRPYRALLKLPAAVAGNSLQLTPAVDVAGVESRLGGAIAENPWIERWPVVVGAVTIVAVEDRWVLLDDQGRSLPLKRSFRHGWSLAALTGGDSLNVFGEWDGFEFEPISVHYGAMLYSLEQIEAMTVLAKAV